MQKTSQLLRSHFDVVLLYKKIGHGLGGGKKRTYLSSGLNADAKFTT